MERWPSQIGTVDWSPVEWVPVLAGIITLAVSKVLTVSKAQGTVTCKKVSGNGKITVNAKTGKVTVKKGLKRGTYKVKVKVTAKGNANWKSGSKTVTFKVKVK